MSDIPAQLGPNTLAELVTALNGPGGEAAPLAGRDRLRACARRRSDSGTTERLRRRRARRVRPDRPVVRRIAERSDAIRGLCTAIAESPADVGISLVPTSTGDYRLDVTDTTSTRLLSVAVPAGRWCRIDTAAPG